jgi:hypothetical protein
MNNKEERNPISQNNKPKALNSDENEEDMDIYVAGHRAIPKPKEEYQKAGLIKQAILLIKKNFKVIIGRPGFLFSHLFTTILVCGVILLINYLTRYSYENEPSMIYPVNEVGPIKKCDFSDNCKSLGYIIIVSSGC